MIFKFNKILILIILVSLPSAIVSFKYRGKMFRYDQLALTL